MPALSVRGPPRTALYCAPPAQGRRHSVRWPPCLQCIRGWWGRGSGCGSSEGRRRVYYVVRMKCGDGVQVSAGEGDLRGVGGMKLKLKGSFRAWWQLRSVAIPPRYVRQTGPAAKTIVTAQIVGQPRSTSKQSSTPGVLPLCHIHLDPTTVSGLFKSLNLNQEATMTGRPGECAYYGCVAVC